MIRQFLFGASMTAAILVAGCGTDSASRSRTESSRPSSLRYDRPMVVDAHGDTVSSRDERRLAYAGHDGMTCCRYPGDIGASEYCEHSQVRGERSDRTKADRISMEKNRLGERADGSNRRSDGQYSALGERPSTREQNWNDYAMVMVNESDCPTAVQNGLRREARNSPLTGTARGTWDGKPAYCGCVVRNGENVRIITDVDGNVLAVRPIE